MRDPGCLSYVPGVSFHPTPEVTFPKIVKELNAKYKAELAAQKARARDSQMTRREQELDDRRTQTAALVTALNAVVRVIERLESRREYLCQWLA